MTSFRSFFESRKCESCSEGVSHYDPNTGYNTDCPSPCPREHDDNYVAEQFNEWLDNVETKLSDDDYFAMVHTQDSKNIRDKFFDVYKNAYTDISEAFNAWIEEHKHLFTAKDYFEMGSAV